MFKSPYPFFGGKSKVADLIWQRLGNPPNTVEPFFGSGALLLSRPGWRPDVDWTETVNDKDGYIANFWRAVQTDPEQVAHYADWPVNENDLHARHSWLVRQRDNLVPSLEGDPDYCDPKIAGWWVWGMSVWIGSGFCSGNGAWFSEDGLLIKRNREDRNATAIQGIVRQSPELHSNRGVRRKIVALSNNQGIRSSAGVDDLRPHLTDNMGVQRSLGVARKLPFVGNKGRGTVKPAATGIERTKPYLKGTEQGVVRQSIRLTGAQGVQRKRVHLLSSKDIKSGAGRGDNGLYSWFEALSHRLRRVRVCSGDWTRIMGESVTIAHGITAVLLDPPYAVSDRDSVYTVEDFEVAHAVRTWAIDNGDNPLLRIVLCGYDEHDSDLPDTWERVTWSTSGGYANQSKGGTNGPTNRHREVLYFSPHCLKPTRYQQSDMFGGQL